jgi:hypothetical protein
MRIFKYLKGTTEFGLWYRKGNNMTMVAYVDADWARRIDDQRSTSRETFYLGDCILSWLSKKHSSVPLYIEEVEYIAVASCSTQVLMMKKTLKDIQVKYDEPISIFYDNTRVISISKNPVMHSKTKHIMIKFHFLQEQVTKNNMKLEYIRTKE